MKNIILSSAVCLSLLATGTTAAFATAERNCDREGLNECFSFQFLVAKHTSSLEKLVRSDPAQSGKNVLKRIERGTARFFGRTTGGTLFLWLKPSVASDSSFVIPANRIREFQYNKYSPRPRAVMPTFEIDPRNFPLLDDPRLPNLGVPDYVLVGKGGNGGVGWSIPKTLREKIAYAVFCPAGDTVTSYPDRRAGKHLGIHFTPEDFKMYRSRDWEYTLEPVLVVEKR